eukprot:g1362.t1
MSSQSSANFEWKKATTLLNGREYTPSRRWGSAHCTVKNELFLSGGCRQEQDSCIHLRDAWMLRVGKIVSELIWEKVQDPPKEFTTRCQHTATLVGHCIWLIGGQSTHQIFGDVFTYNLSSKEWHIHNVKNTSAMRRAGHCAIVSPREPEKIILFGGSIPGGSNASGETPELAIFDTKTLTVVPISTHTAKYSPCSSSIPVHLTGTRVLFLGGGDFNQSVKRGSCCFDTEKLKWTENFIDCPLLEGLMGAKGAIYENRVYIYGGNYVDQKGTYLPTLIELTLDQNCSSVKTRSFTSVNLPGRYNHVLFRVDSNLYLLQGREPGDEARTHVYYMDLKKLPSDTQSTTQSSKITVSDGTNNNLDALQIGVKVDEDSLLLTIPLKDAGLLSGRGCKNWEEIAKQKDIELKTANEKQFVCQNQLEALKTENSRLKSDLEKNEQVIKQITDDNKEMRAFFSSIGEQISRLSSSSKSTINEDAHQAKKHRSL